LIAEVANTGIRSARAMPASTKGEHGCDNEETDHRVLDSERISARGRKIIEATGGSL